MCETPSRHKQTNKRTQRYVRLFVRLFLHCVYQVRPSYGWMKRDALEILGGGIKNPDRNFVG